MKKIIMLFAVIASQFSMSLANADGSETLGEPSIAIANGTDIITAGTGLLNQPGEIVIEIPQGAVVKQVLLYWNGFANYRSEADDSIVIAGNEVTGSLISGDDGDWFYYLLKSWSFRADITNLGLVAQGVNTFTVDGLAFKLANNGAGMLVIVDDGSGTIPLSILDGDDLAYIEFASPRDTTVPQTFTFAAAATDRMATIDMFFAAVQGAFSTLGQRPTVIEVTVGGNVYEYNDQVGSFDGDEWDTFEIMVPVPAGVTSLTVQALSEDRLNTGDTPASFVWLAAGLTIPPPEQPQLGSLGDFVWNDLDADGIQDNGEPGIPGVTVNLYTTDSNGNCSIPAGTTTTATDGSYGFADLSADDYCVEFVESTAETALGCDADFSPANNTGTTDALDSDANATSGLTAVIALGEGEDNPTVDAGLSCPPQPELGSLGDFVWEDLNADGIQDNGEPGIPGVTVNLFTTDSNGNCSIPAGTTTTATDGSYGFADLSADDYCVEFVESTAETALGCDADFSLANNTGTTEALDSDANTISGLTSVIALGEGEDNPRIDAGLYCPAKLGDFVWKDLNRDGIQDSDEPGFDGVNVTLYQCNADGTFTDKGTIPTSADGSYEFDGLMPGNYYVQFETQDGYVFTLQNVSGNTLDLVDSDANSTGATMCMPLVSNQDDPTRDAGLHAAPASGLGDLLWEDKNANGEQDPDELGVSGATVTLLLPGVDEQCNTADDVFTDATTTTSDGLDGMSVGMYSFEDLFPGRYCVAFDLSTADLSCSFGDGPVFTAQNAAGDALDSDVDPATGKTGNIDLGLLEYDPTNDAGIYCPAKIGDTVWKDDGDGIQEDGEPGADGVEVKLYACGADGNIVGDAIDTAYTSGGTYMFDNLVPGSYAVQFIEPADFDFTSKDAVDPVSGTNDDTLDSDADSAGFTECREVGSNEYDDSLDAGLIDPPDCGLGLVKTCEVVTPPAPPLESCQGKIQSFTLIWTGGDISIDGIDNDSDGTVVNGQQVTFSAPIGGWDSNDNFLTISGAETGESVFHVSCSDGDMDGETDDPAYPADCGKRVGDGKDTNDSFVKLWEFEGLTDGQGQVVDCTVDPPVGTSSCEFSATVASCDTLPDKPTMFSFQYTGGGCDAADNSQGSKFECSGLIAPDSTVTLMTSAGQTIYDVKPGDLVTIEKDGSETAITLDDGAGGIETIVFHTSCSVPLITDEVYGSLTLTALDGQGSGKEVLYSYLISNGGNNAIADILVTDSEFGTIGTVPSLNAGASTTLTALSLVSATTTNVATATGSGGGQCEATAEATVTVLPPPPCSVTYSFKELRDDKIKYTVTNTGTSNATLDEFTLNFPSAYGVIKEVKLDGAIYKSGDSSLVVEPLVTIGIVDWTQSDVSKRVLEPGESRTLEIRFTKKSKSYDQGDFSGTLKFNDGDCMISL